MALDPTVSNNLIAVLFVALVLYVLEWASGARSERHFNEHLAKLMEMGTQERREESKGSK